MKQAEEKLRVKIEARFQAVRAKEKKELMVKVRKTHRLV